MNVPLKSRPVAAERRTVIEAVGEGPRRCVYTVLNGGYESLNEQPVARCSALPFYCFTDDPGLISETWRIRPMAPLFRADPARSGRAAKMFPHRILPEFDQSLYIDNSVILREPPEILFDAADLSTGLCLAPHSFRNTVLEEFLAVFDEHLADPARVLEQLNHYAQEAPETLGLRPFWCGLMLRDHRRPAMTAAMDIWFSHVLRYARRDQLSAVRAFRQAKLVPGLLPIDNHASRFHRWPHASGRGERRVWREKPEPRILDGPSVIALSDAALRTASDIWAVRQNQHAADRDSWARALAEHESRSADLMSVLSEQAAKLAAAEAGVAMLREDLDEREREVAAILSSTSWRMTDPIRRLGEAVPSLSRLMRRFRRGRGG